MSVGAERRARHVVVEAVKGRLRAGLLEGPHSPVPPTGRAGTHRVRRAPVSIRLVRLTRPWMAAPLVPEVLVPWPPDRALAQSGVGVRLPAAPVPHGLTPAAFPRRRVDHAPRPFALPPTVGWDGPRQSPAAARSVECVRTLVQLPSHHLRCYAAPSA
jgi:hypothetical protein